MGGLTRALLRGVLGFTQGPSCRRLMAAAQAPEQTQAALLRALLARNKDTQFGKTHGFAGLAGAEDYRRAVPAQTYEDLWPLVRRQELTGERCLTEERPVYYNRTSGTVGAPKNIPVTASGLRQMKTEQRLSAYVWARDSHFLDGKVFAVTGPALEGRMEGGTEFGSVSGLIYRNQSGLVRSRQALPPALSDIEDYEARYLAMVIFGLAEEGVTGLAAANPSTFLRLLTALHRHADAVFDAVATGRLPDLPPPARGRLRPRPARARELAQRLEAAGELTYADIWPRLQGVLTWTGGSCGVALAALSRLLPAGVAIIEWGYSASEFRGSLNIDAKRNVCLPTLLTTYFEFVEREAQEEGRGDRRDFLGLHELEQGREYYVFITTGEGLYRYDMNDIVRVKGRVGQTPAIEFARKGKGVANITGEKLTETQVLQAVSKTLARRGVAARFFVMLAYEETPGYKLFVELENAGSAPGGDPGRTGGTADAMAGEIDSLLSEANVEYQAKRKSGRLAPLETRLLPGGAGDRYREACVGAGQRDAQFKHLHLQYARECAVDFEAAAGGA